MAFEITFKRERTDRDRPWWKRRRARAIAAITAGALIAMGCAHVPESYRAACKAMTKILELLGAA
jgi:hypothetical protein